MSCGFINNCVAVLATKSFATFFSSLVPFGNSLYSLHDSLTKKSTSFCPGNFSNTLVNTLSTSCFVLSSSGKSRATSDKIGFIEGEKTKVPTCSFASLYRLVVLSCLRNLCRFAPDISLSLFTKVLWYRVGISCLFIQSYIIGYFLYTCQHAVKWNLSLKSACDFYPFEKFFVLQYFSCSPDTRSKRILRKNNLHMSSLYDQLIQSPKQRSATC